MKKTKLTRSLLAACSIVALSVALSGCLHSGGDDGDQMETGGTTPGGTALTWAALTGGEEVAPGTYHITGAPQTFADALEDTDIPTEGYVTGDEVDIGGLSLRCAAGPCGLTINDDGSFTTTGTITVVMEGGTHPMISEPEPTEEEIAAATAEAATMATAIATEAAQVVGGTAGTDGAGGADAGLGGSTASAITAGDAGSYTLGIEWDDDADAQSVTITVEGATDDDDVEIAPDENGMLVRAMDADSDGNIVRERAMVVTDIEAPTPVAFVMWESNLAGDTPQALNTRDLDDTVNADGEGTAADDWTALTVEQNAATYMLVASSAFAAGTGATLTFDGDDTPTDNTDDAFEAAGTYNGADGTYRCDGTADCTVTLDAMGAITTMTGTWVFTPDAGAMSDQPDYDYLHYGVWLQETEDSDGAITINEVETFAGSSVAASGSVDTVEGTATYSGGAAGVYVRNVFDSQGNIETATSGHFTADANLTATFGQITTGDDANSIAPRLVDTLTGTIDNFVLEHGEENEWAVSLQSDGDATTAGIQPDTDGVMAGTASGGVTGMDGSFTATYHGSVAALTDGTIPQPHTVVGEFNANFSNGAVAGGFGARQDD